MTARNCLSRWLQPHFTKYPNFGQATKSLATFFKVDSAVGQLRLQAVRQQTEMMQKSKAAQQVGGGVKRPHRSSSDSGDEKKSEDLQDLYNVDCKKEKDVVASSIFAQSSEGISFCKSANSTSNCNSKSIDTDQKQATSSAPKKKKIKIAANKAFSDSPCNSDEVKKENDSGASNSQVQPNKNVARSWIKRFQKLYGAETTNQVFKDCIRQYKTSDDFNTLLPVLGLIVKKRQEDEALLEDFKTFVTTRHLSDFQTFLDVTLPQLLPK